VATSGTPQQAWAIGDVNGRIDQCIKDNSAPELLLWVVLTLMVLAGLFALVYGVLHDIRYLAGGGVGATGLTSWPVLKLIQLYRRKMALSVIPAITALLSPADAAREIHALIKSLLDKA
jgi:hypothetical protein